MLTPITAPPPQITIEEHAQLTGSTPANFADIPPVLRWMDEVEVDMGGEGYWEGKLAGRLWVTEEAVAFLPNSGQPGFSLSYRALTLHAVTSASEAGPAHLYCQVDDRPGDANGGGDDSDDGEDMEMREVRVYVAEEKLQPLFDALATCSAINDSPNPNGQTSHFPFIDNDDDEDNDEAWEDADEDADDQANGGEGAVGGEGGRIRSDFHSGGGPGARFRPY